MMRQRSSIYYVHIGGGGVETPYASPISVIVKSAYGGEGGVRLGLNVHT